MAPAWPADTAVVAQVVPPRSGPHDFPPLTATSSAPLWGSEGMAESPAQASPAQSQGWGHEALTCSHRPSGCNMTGLIQTNPFVRTVGPHPMGDGLHALGASPTPIFQDKGKAQRGSIPGWSPDTPGSPFSTCGCKQGSQCVCLWPCRKVVIFSWGLQFLFWALYVFCRSKGTEMALGLLSLTSEHLLARVTKNTFSLRGKGNTSWQGEGVERKP